MNVPLENLSKAELVEKIKNIERYAEDRVELEIKIFNMLAGIKRLNSLLPICAFCNKVRSDKEYWDQIKAFIKEHSKDEFGHGICPECAEKCCPDLKGK